MHRRTINRGLAELGAVEILVNNAGGSRPFGLDATEEQWEEVITSTSPGNASSLTGFCPG